MKVATPLILRDGGRHNVVTLPRHVLLFSTKIIELGNVF